MSEWRKIESAPKDGSYVLLWPQKAKRRIDGIMRKEIRPTVGRYHITAGKVKKEMWVGTNGFIEPTHWMPLPEAPTTDRKHETSKECWCGPTLDYVDPESGNEVYVHHKSN